MASAGNSDANGSVTEPLLRCTRESKPTIWSGGVVSAWSKLVFSWLNPILERGAKRPLETADLPPLAPSDQARTALDSLQAARLLRHRKQQAEEEGEGRGGEASSRGAGHGVAPAADCHRGNHVREGPLRFFWLLACCHTQTLLCSGLFALLKVATASASPVFVHFFIALASQDAELRPAPPEADVGRRRVREGCALAAGMCACKLVESVAERQWFFRARRAGMRMRSATVAAVFHKQLRLSSQARRRHPAGEVLNYTALDAFRVGELAFWLHFVWATPLTVAASTAVLCWSVGWAATLAGLGVIVLLVLANHPVARLQQRALAGLTAAQGGRLRATAEYLRSIKILKLQAWEDWFRGLTERLRAQEMSWLVYNQHIRAFHSLLFWMSPALVSSATFAACALFGVPLNAGNVFTALAAFRVVQEPIRGVPDLILALIQTRVSLARITRFLAEEELQGEAVHRRSALHSSDGHVVQIRQACFSWDANESPTLRNINLAVEPGQLVAVCGEVGAGKSSLLMSILGEITRISGEVKVYGGSIAYVSQTPWIESGSIRDVILFGKAMDYGRYQAVLRACALEQDIQEFPFKDFTEIGERGLNLSGGQKQRVQLARALYQDADIYLLDDPFSAVDAHTVSSLFKDYILGALSGKVVILVTHQVEFLPAVDLIVLLQNGEIRQVGRYDELNTEGSDFQKLILAHQEAMSVVQDSAKASSRAPPPSQTHVQLNLPNGGAQPLKGAPHHQLTKAEEMEAGTGSWKAVFDYLAQANGWFHFFASIAATVVFTLGQTGSNFWLAKNVNDPSVSSDWLVTVYSLLAILACVFAYVRSWFVAVMGLCASSSFFSALSTSIFRAPMSFFDSTPTGRIITRFSSDLASLDTDLPFSLGHSASAFVNYLGVLLVFGVVAWPTLILSIPVLFIAVRLQAYYLLSARELMRINGRSKAPIVQHMADTIAGSVTIRAFEKDADFMRKALALVDCNSNPFLHSMAATEWLVLRVELLAAVVLASSAVAMVVYRDYISPGMTGLALSYALTVNNILVFAVQNQCTSANLIVSVERIRQYMGIPSKGVPVREAKHSGSLETWPERGEVVFDNLQVRYRANAPLVLHGISCLLKGGDRVGIVGRTGSGKSTLISALFRLVEPAGGRIVIDGVDIGTVGLHQLRTRLSIIPQDPALFRGSVRFNLDPLSQYADQQLWEALDYCQLADAIRSKPGQLGAEVGDDGENWSVGQRQLLCLGRVLLKQSCILVLDEATASIDNSTDSILQRVIRKAFGGCTVITVAHRIPTVVDSDRVMVLSDGMLTEFDIPSKLLEKEDSFFSRLVAEYRAQDC